jgi:hypothetical protein
LQDEAPSSTTKTGGEKHLHGASWFTSHPMSSLFPWKAPCFSCTDGRAFQKPTASWHEKREVMRKPAAGTVLWCWTATPLGASSSVSFPRSEVNRKCIQRIYQPGYDPSQILNGWKIWALAEMMTCLHLLSNILLLVTSTSCFEYFMTGLTRV